MVITNEDAQKLKLIEEQNLELEKQIKARQDDKLKLECQANLLRL